MSEMYFTRQHAWVRFGMGKAFVGLTGRDIVGDVVYIELPQIGERVEKGQPCATVEAIKSTTDVYAPIDGIVSAVNGSVFDDPDKIALAPMKTWLFRLDFEKEADTSGLLDERAYSKL